MSNRHHISDSLCGHHLVVLPFMVGILGPQRCSISLISDSVTGLSQIMFVLIMVLRLTTEGQPSVCNYCLATLAQAISLGVRSLVFSSIVWTCDVTFRGETFSWDEDVC